MEGIWNLSFATRFGGRAMSKRFTETTKWDKAWFRKLPPKMKCVWLFLCDRCDHAGVWEIDAEAFEHYIGEPVTLQEITSIFGDQVEILDKDKLFIKYFIEFQYGVLNPENRVHLSVLNRLEKFQNKGLISSLLGAKDKDKDKDKNKDSSSQVPLDFLALYEIYPRHEGKSKGLKTCEAQIKDEVQYGQLKQAIINYRAKCTRERTDIKFIKLFSTFMNCWTDYLDPKIGSAPEKKNLQGEQARKHREYLDQTIHEQKGPDQLPLNEEQKKILQRFKKPLDSKNQLLSNEGNNVVNISEIIKTIPGKE
jgi:hypothetical protein